MSLVTVMRCKSLNFTEEEQSSALYLHARILNPYHFIHDCLWQSRAENSSTHMHLCETSSHLLTLWMWVCQQFKSSIKLKQCLETVQPQCECVHGVWFQRGHSAFSQRQTGHDTRWENAAISQFPLEPNARYPFQKCRSNLAWGYFVLISCIMVCLLFLQRKTESQ